MICDVVVSRMMNSNLLSRKRSTTLTKASTKTRSAGPKWQGGPEGYRPVLVACLEHVGLFYDLARITQKLGAVVGERATPR